jgi:hypothetical protein
VKKLNEDRNNRNQYFLEIEKFKKLNNHYALQINLANEGQVNQSRHNETPFTI